MYILLRVLPDFREDLSMSHHLTITKYVFGVTKDGGLIRQLS